MTQVNIEEPSKLTTQVIRSILPYKRQVKEIGSSILNQPIVGI
jgi:hypothetical protein